MTQASSNDSIPERLTTCLRNGPFTRYMGGEAVSMTGTWMQFMAQGWVMTSLTTSALMLGLVNFATGIPMLVLSLRGGDLADRWDKRKILLVAQVLQILLALLVGVLVASEAIQVWHVIAVAFLLGLVFAFEMPAATALVPELVGREQIATAIAMDRSVFHGTRLIGPAVAGYVVARWGEATAFFLNALSFLALIVALLSIRLPRPSSPTGADEGADTTGVAAGWRYVRSDRPTLAMISLMALSTLCVYPVLVVMLPLYARHTLGLAAERMGWLMGFAALGSLVGALGLLAVPVWLRRRLLALLIVGVGMGLVGLSLAPVFAWAAPSLIVLALSVSTLVGLAHTVIQERAPGQMRGRVSAIAGLSFFGLMPFASLAVATLADELGLRTVLAGGALVYVFLGLPVLFGFTRTRWDTLRTGPPGEVPPTPAPPTESW